MKYEMHEMEEKAVLDTAAAMVAAATTAPKGHGVDSIVSYVLTGDEKEALAKKMEEVGTRLMGDEMPTWYGRDAKNVRQAQAVVIIGAKKLRRGMTTCGMCGYKNCAENAKNNGVCAAMFMDWGIAMGSAVSIAADHRIDNRIMFSIHMTLREMPEFDQNYYYYGIPLSVSAKNPMMDRGIVHKL